MCVEGDMLKSQDDITLHQPNCVSKNVLGLAKDLFKTCPREDVYKNRKGHVKPGSMQTVEQEEGKPTMINCNAQFVPGKARVAGPDGKANNVCDVLE